MIQTHSGIRLSFTAALSGPHGHFADATELMDCGYSVLSGGSCIAGVASVSGISMAAGNGEAESITQALAASRRKITVFISTALALMVVFGSLMYLVEGGRNFKFTASRTAFIAATTMTTVGYGDIAPVTPWPRIAALIMIMGYGIIAVPTGIVTLELNEANVRQANTVLVRNVSQKATLKPFLLALWYTVSTAR